MIDPDNLRTASLYINNQLLSRGLLHDGQSIDFANPETSDGGLQVAMGRIISVVNDLILRRDRDAEHRESLSCTLRTLRADVQRQTTELARQTEKLSEAQRQLDIAEATEHALRAHLKTAEQGIHKLKDEMAKLKSLVAQTRNACANEVRKRDRQIDGLKKAMTEAGRVRGGGKSRDVISISVTGDFGGPGQEVGMPAGATANEGYSLRMETNEFLTQLARGLSEENEGLLSLVRHTVDGLREMSGLEQGMDACHESSRGSQLDDEFATYPPKKTAEELAGELETVVEHLRSILTNPSFVPIEEVEVRDEAIHRLRAGLETMEARWQDAVHMIDGWRTRMVSGGRSVDMEDLQMGLRLSPVRVRDVQETSHAVPLRVSRAHEGQAEEQVKDIRRRSQPGADRPEPQQFRTKSPAESLRLVPAPGYEAEELGDESDSDSSMFQDDIDELDDEEPNVQILQISTAESIDSSPLPEPPQISPLKDSSYSSGNRGSSQNRAYRKKPEDFNHLVEENAWNLVESEKELPPPRHVNKPASPKHKSIKARASTPPPVDDDDALESYTASYDSPLFGKSGEKPSRAQLNRKLFSRPSTSEKKRSNNTGQSSKEASPPSRGTRSTGRKSTEISPSNASPGLRRTLSEPNRSKGNANGNSNTTTANQGKQSAEGGQRNSGPNTAVEKQSRLPGPAQPATTASRLPRPNSQQNPLNMATIVAKLAASEREADAARVRAKLKAVRRSQKISEVDEGVHATPAKTQTQPSQVPSKVQTRSQARAQAQARTTETETRNTKQIHDGTVSPKESTAHEHSMDEDMDPVKRVVHNERSRRRPSRRQRNSRGDLDEDVNEIDELKSIRDDGHGLEHGREMKALKTDMNMDMDSDLEKRRLIRRVSKVVSRRRSTLNPWELQGLIQGSVNSPVR